MITLSDISLTQKLYESSNSEVYRGYVQASGQPVILKMLKNAYSNPERLGWFWREYEVTRSLNLSGIPRVCGFSNDGNSPFFLLEDVGAESLSRLKIAGNLDLRDFLQLAIDITDILSQIHEQNIIHKDINPSNIVLNPQTRTVKIIDFGISAVLSQENPSFPNANHLEGTLAYMSPEQTGRMNRCIDYRTDFYSLGVTFYHLLSGTLPFQSEDPMEWVHSHIAKPPISLQTIKPQIPATLSNLIAKLMAKNADERYQSGWGLKADLEECLRQLQTENTISRLNLGQQDRSDRFQLPQQLYGREAEIQTLLKAFDRIAEGKRELIFVAGYAGVGKSILVRELYKPVAAKRGNFIAGKFDQYQKNIPYLGLIQALNEFCNFILGETEAVFHEWRSRILAALGNTGQVLIEMIPNLENIIGPQPPVADLGGQEAQNRLHWVVQNFLKALCDRQHPLVIFLDDLQWSDRASLSLLEAILSDRDLQFLLVIGAYRDHEVDDTHPLMMTKAHLQPEFPNLITIALENLTASDVANLMAATLHSPQSLVQPLADLVYEKTLGNAFFTLEFLNTLYQEGLIYFSGDCQNWDWNLAQIQAQEITDNVVDLMARQLVKLSLETQTLLQLAACIGSPFDLETLSRIARSQPEVVFSQLFATLQSGFVIPLTENYKLLRLLPEIDRGKIQFKFLHDRVQQAAYSLIPEAQRPERHLEIGRLLQDSIIPQGCSPHDPSTGLADDLLIMVNHLNQGSELMTEESEKIDLAYLNLWAGKKAKLASAYSLATEYLNCGLRLLPSQSWQTHYDLTLQLHLEAVEAEYLITHYPEVEALAAVVLNQGRTLLERVKVYQILIQLYSAINHLQQAVDTSLRVLEMLGVSLAELAPIQWDIAELSRLPLMEEPDKLAAMQILMSVWGTAIIVTPEWVPRMALTMVKLSLEYGNSPRAAFAYAYYGFNLCRAGEIEQGYQLGQFALELLDQFESAESRCKVYHIFNGFIRHWKEPLPEAIAGLRTTVRLGLETGDIEYTCYATMQYSCYSLLSGEPLEKVIKKHQDSLQIIEKHQQNIQWYYTKIWLQLALNLRINNREVGRLNGEAFDDHQDLQTLTQNKSDTSLFCFHLAQGMLSYYLKEDQKAVESLTIAAQYEAAIASLMPLGQLPFYDSLARLALYPSVEESQQQDFLQRVELNQMRLQDWAKSGPMTYQHKYDLVAAEKARILGQNWQAAELYERAIVGARDHHFLQEAALAYELAGEFYLHREMLQIAELYIQKADALYQQWQGGAKVQQLSAQYPQWLDKPQKQMGSENASETLSETIQSTSSKPEVVLDLVSVLKSSAALTREIEIEKLLGALMKILIENAGAQKGYLIGEENGEWMVQAAIDENLVTTQPGIPLNAVGDGTGEGDLLSGAIVRYVLRTRETVALNNATSEGPFRGDRYIRAQQPKSILCMPILDRTKLSGIIYLENNLISGAFPSDRLEVLKFLSVQAAISLENAKLYTSLRQSESKFNQFLEALPIGISAIDPSGKFHYRNQAGKQLLGEIAPDISLEELSTFYQIYLAGSSRLYPQEQLPGIRALQGEAVMAEDLEILREGERIPLQVYSTPIFDETGQVIYAINAFTDISDRKQAEQLRADYNHTLEVQVAERTEALRESEERFRNAFESAAVGMCLVARNGQLLNVNSAVCQMLGYSKSELLALTIQDITYPEDRESDWSHLEELVQGEISYYHLEKRYQHKNGKIIWGLLSVSLVRDQDNQPLYTIKQIQNITLRKNLELNLQEKTEEIDRFFTMSLDLLCIGDLDGYYRRASLGWERTLGYSIAELEGRLFKIFDLVHPDDVELTLNAMADLNNGREVINVINRYRHKNGSYRWLEWRSMPAGDLIYATARDITESRAAQEKLRHSEANLAKAQEIAHIGSWEFDLVNQSTLWSDELYRIYGLEPSPTSPSLEPIYPRIHPETPGLEQREIQDKLRCAEPWELNQQVQRPSGEIREIEVRGEPVFDREGRLVKWVGTVHDITDRQQIEAKLRQSEAALREAQRIAHIGSWERDLNTDQLTASEEWFQMFGVDPAYPESAYQEHFNAIHPEDRVQLQQNLNRAIVDGRSYQMDLRIMAGDRILRYLEARGEAVRDEKGAVIHLRGTVLDITERKRTVLALSESEERFRTAFDYAGIGMAIVGLDGQWLKVNRAVCEIIGYSESELLTLDFQTITHPEDLDLDLNYAAQLLRGEIGSYQLEKRYIHKQGHSIRVLLTGSLVRTAEGEPLHFIAQIQDVTLQKQAEQILRSQMQREQVLSQFVQSIRNSLELTTISFSAAHESGRLLGADMVKILQYFPEEALWRNVAEYRPFDTLPSTLDLDIPDVKNPVTDGIKRLQPVALAGWEPHPDDPQVELIGSFAGHWLILPLQMGTGVWGALCLARNLSESPWDSTEMELLLAIANQLAIALNQAELYQQVEKAREAADKANQAKSAFLANMSHELRSPLNAILGFAQLLLSNPSLSQEAKENVAIIHRSGEHLLTLINDILDLAKIESGRTTIVETNFNLSHLLDDLQSMFRLKAQSKGLGFVVERSPEVPEYIRTDEIKLRQVLINLLGNAIKFTQRGQIYVAMRGITPEGRSSLSVPDTLEPQTLNLLCEVSDTGPGIAQEELDHLFQAFVQTSTGLEAREGTGLGLSISRKFVELMGGSIEVRSQIGEGSTFSFEIPVKVAGEIESKPIPLQRRAIALEPNQPQYRILIADDRPDNRTFVIKCLQPLGFDLLESSNGQETIALWEEWEPHLIFMDLRMPVMDGYEATQQIKGSIKGQGTAIVALTASYLNQENALSLSSGFDGFIRKPFRDTELFDCLSEQLGVRFVYEDPKADAKPTLTVPPVPLMESDWRDVPLDWLNSFDLATKSCDVELMIALLDEICDRHESFANTLMNWTQNFEFEQISTLIKSVLD
ncbi:PAS domain S-box protein [Oscillatoria acuminata]|uniref:Circadian input-output histidine kinase CikA n=1 Tax=Oscillatoria acuminata PCC 6304 TaxID=56110 RepID=K9TKI5_9CYAN|nr:PAS domain S-box protein [Oscillatoria acuminata]AFY83055.1 PAS domain S-box [Oscillatoria acuminata PCC 6304]